MIYQNFIILILNLSFFVHGHVESNLTKLADLTAQNDHGQNAFSDNPFVVYENCSSCYYYNHLVCMDSKCYCAPNYKWDPNNKFCWYSMCFSDPDCYQSQDIHRKCKDFACVCKFSYFEDWTNGRKCTYRLSIWTWIWIFILLPIIGIGAGIVLFIKRRRKNRNQAQPTTSHQDQIPDHCHKTDF